jgi:hypothetical protein
VGSRAVSIWLQFNRVNTLEALYTESSPVDASFYGVLILIALFVINARWTRLRSILGSNVPLLLYFGYCAVSVAWSDSPGMAFKR